MNRIAAIDLARGFTVLFIPIIHCVMLYGTVEVHHSLLGGILAFFAEWPGAQILMLLMGVSFALQKSISPSKTFIKVLLLWALGYLMNYLKVVLPVHMGIMPKDFLVDYKLPLPDLFLTGDILQFAALALLLLLLISQIPYAGLLSLYLAGIVLLASPLLWDLHSANPALNHILNLFTAQPPYTYFPVFPWLVYPLVGLSIGLAIKQKREALYHELLFLGGFVCLLEYLTQLTKFHFPKTSFYRTYPDATLMHLGFVIAWLALWHFISKKYSQKRLFSMLTFLSKNITLIYFIQWILIFWCFPLIGYHRLALGMSIIVSVSMTAVVFLITYLTTWVFKRPPNPRQPQSSITKKQLFSYESTDHL